MPKCSYYIHFLSPRTQTIRVSVSTYSPMPGGVFAHTRHASEFFVTSGVVRQRSARNSGDPKIHKEARSGEKTLGPRAVRKDHPVAFSRGARGSGLMQSGSAASAPNGYFPRRESSDKDPCSCSAAIFPKSAQTWIRRGARTPGQCDPIY